MRTLALLAVALVLLLSFAAPAYADNGWRTVDEPPTLYTAGVPALDVNTPLAFVLTCIPNAIEGDQIGIAIVATDPAMKLTANSAGGTIIAYRLDDGQPFTLTEPLIPDRTLAVFLPTQKAVDAFGGATWAVLAARPAEAAPLTTRHTTPRLSTTTALCVASV